MPEKIPTYNVDEALLRSKLLGHTVEVNAERCQAIEADIANLRFKKTFDIPKVNLRIVAPAAAIILVVMLVLFNLESLSALFASAPDVKKPEIKASVPDNKPLESVTSPGTQTTATVSVPTPVANNVPQTPQNAVVSNADSSPSKKSENPVQDNAKKPNPVLAQPPSDSAAKISEPSKQDTSVQNAEPVKKKKRRRRRHSDMDELKESTLQSGSADDDVVVPQ
jgi:hypothetical protein